MAVRQEAETEEDRAEPAPSAVMGERRRLIGLAYRLLGSLADAEDAVQEAYTRWYAMPGEQRRDIASPGAWLTRVAGRICLDLLGSARVRRERYVGEWVPEPLPGGTDRTAGAPPADPAEQVALDESVGMAFLVMLESMTPAERVAFVLHDVFRYPFAEVARIVGRSPAACRRLASSARRRVPAPRTPVPEARQARIVREFKEAWEAADVDALIGLLAPDATGVADGGGRAGAARRPVRGGERIARYLLAFADRMPRPAVLERTVNGRPGLVVLEGGTVVTVAAFDIEGDRIKRIWAVRNPDKLRAWTADAPRG
ncbi:RNA polymerase sigma factor SigJ [Nocardiopsis potens]|uniref:RNA polymerase sigma factor SigJ n=1 Tax=Nocardiopsis potens TaxID=1246458 RepID=UPI000345FB9D|nr:RNA polymerase sigma factor SigJ [Nocardiopsis potens]